MVESLFVDLLATKKLSLSSKQLEMFAIYYRLLIEENQKINLTALTSKEDVYLKHFYDSLSLSFNNKLSSQKIIDVGTGAGFPGIPLKIVYPDLRLTLVEPITKRTKFLELVTKTLNLDVEIINQRAEDYIKDHYEKYDFAVTRAVANLRILLELCIPFIKVSGDFVAYKSSNYLEELKDSSNALKKLNAEIRECYEYEIKDAKRVNLTIRKTAKTNRLYPRNYASIKHKPL